jgi:hypothetical protein
LIQKAVSSLPAAGNEEHKTNVSGNQAENSSSDKGSSIDTSKLTKLSSMREKDMNSSSLANKEARLSTL